MNQIELEKHNAATPPDRSRENKRQQDAAVTAERCPACALKAKFLILPLFCTEKAMLAFMLLSSLPQWRPVHLNATFPEQ